VVEEARREVIVVEIGEEDEVLEEGGVEGGAREEGKGTWSLAHNIAGAAGGLLVCGL
jgi:hypothetical protein